MLNTEGAALKWRVNACVYVQYMREIESPVGEQKKNNPSRPI